jgi:hypothetical protein
MDLLSWLTGQKPKKIRSKRQRKPKTARQKRRAEANRLDTDFERKYQEAKNFASWRAGEPKKVRRRPMSFRNPSGT